MTLALNYAWNSISNEWNISGKQEYSYDAMGNKTLFMSFNWDSSTSEWMLNSKSEYAYDRNGNEILYIWIYWNSDNHEILFSGKFETCYDAKGRKISVAYYDWDSSSLDWKICNITYYAFKPSLLVNSAEEIKIFPNPFRDILYIGLPEKDDYTSFELFDSAGRKILTSKENVTDLSFLTSGYYMIRLKDKMGNTIKTKKLIKE